MLCALRRVLRVHLVSTFSGLCCNMLFGCGFDGFMVGFVGWWVDGWVFT